MFDVVIQNGLVVDGSGAPAYKADLAIANGKIVEVANHISVEQTAKVIDASGKYVTPGFIDTHRHADAALFRPGFGEAEIRQGLTTIVDGNCGLSPYPCPDERKEEILSYLTPVIGSVPASVPMHSFKDYFDAVHTLNPPLKVEGVVGNGTVCAAVKGYGEEAPDASQMKEIHRHLEQSLADGAKGISIGLGYSPECLFSTETMIEMLRPLSGSGRPLFTHVRGEGDGIVNAIPEVIHIAKTLGVQLEVNHLKCIGKRNWGHTMMEVLAMMDRARADGLEVGCDLYPYRAGSTQLILVLPNEFKRHGVKQLLDDLKDPEVRKQITKALSTPSDTFENIVELCGWDHIQMSTLLQEKNLKYQGKSVTEIAKMRGTDPFNCAYDMLIEENGVISMIDEYASEEDVRLAMKHPFSSIISDAIYPDGILHPRLHGAFLRILETYVREENVLTLEEAVRKMTSLPASVMHLDDRGLIKKGYDADVLVFDLAKIHTGATYENPTVLGEGIDWSLIDGKPIIENGKYMRA